MKIGRLTIWHLLLIPAVMILIGIIMWPIVTNCIEINTNEERHIIAKQLNTEDKNVVLDTSAEDYYTETISKRIIKFKVIGRNDTNHYKSIYYKTLFGKKKEIALEHY